MLRWEWVLVLVGCAWLSGCSNPGISPERYSSWCRQLDEVRLQAGADQDRVAARAPSTLRDQELLSWRAVQQALLLAQAAGSLAYADNDAHALDEVQDRINAVIALYPGLRAIVKEHEPPYDVDPGLRHEGNAELPR